MEFCLTGMTLIPPCVARTDRKATKGKILSRENPLIMDPVFTVASRKHQHVTQRGIRVCSSLRGISHQHCFPFVRHVNAGAADFTACTQWHKLQAVISILGSNALSLQHLAPLTRRARCNVKASSKCGIHLLWRGYACGGGSWVIFCTVFLCNS